MCAGVWMSVFINTLTCKLLLRPGTSRGAQYLGRDLVSVIFHPIISMAVTVTSLIPSLSSNFRLRDLTGTTTAKDREGFKGSWGSNKLWDKADDVMTQESGSRGWR